MNIETIIALVLVVLGLLIAIGPQPHIGPFHVCEHDMVAGIKNVCYWTARAELGMGAAIVLLSVLSIFVKSKDTRTGLGVGILATSVLALLVPTVLIGVCAGAMMTCRTTTLPALTAIGVLAVVFSVVYILQSRRKARAA
ncbi:MAG: DUF4418 family protein [Candidatus Methanoplasma sp.]|nr:DUF4418 family protein [Candidatus Methanoplasma sp.]